MARRQRVPRDGDEVRHVLTQFADYPDGTAGAIDLLSPVWNTFDLLPAGRGEWLPDNDYPGDCARRTESLSERDRALALTRRRRSGRALRHRREDPRGW